MPEPSPRDLKRFRNELRSLDKELAGEHIRSKISEDPRIVKITQWNVIKMYVLYFLAAFTLVTFLVGIPLLGFLGVLTFALFLGWIWVRDNDYPRSRP